jgi:nicotinamidase-related amidase
LNTALLLIDIQQDYFPGGRMEVPGAIEAGNAAQRLLTMFHDRELPVVHIQHISMRKGATFFLPGTEGIMIHDSVKPVQGETVLQKNFPNSFRGTELAKVLEKMHATELVICGMMSQMCIDATTRAAFDAGFTCTVAHDACAARPLMFRDITVPAQQVHAAYMAALAAVYAQVKTADEILTIHRHVEGYHDD